MVFPHTPSTLEVIQCAQHIAFLSGASDYLKIQAKSVSDSLLALHTIPGEIRAGAETYSVHRRNVPNYVQRRLNAKSRERMRATYPRAYTAAVRELPPEHVYTPRLDSARARASSEEWSAHKTTGVEHWTAALRDRLGDRDWSRPSVRAASLRDIREWKRTVDAEEEAARLGLVDFVVENDLPLTIPGLRDGRVVLRENGPRFMVDYDLLEQQFPAAAALLTRTPVTGFDRIDFRAERRV